MYTSRSPAKPRLHSYCFRSSCMHTHMHYAHPSIASMCLLIGERVCMRVAFVLFFSCVCVRLIARACQRVRVCVLAWAMGHTRHGPPRIRQRPLTHSAVVLFAVHARTHITGITPGSGGHDAPTTAGRIGLTMQRQQQPQQPPQQPQHIYGLTIRVPERNCMAWHGMAKQ